MAYFPFFVDLSGSRGLIVGGGAVALRKVQKLLPYGPELRPLLAKQICSPCLLNAADRWRRRTAIRQ